jgi:hypothetical protein
MIPAVRGRAPDASRPTSVAIAVAMRTGRGRADRDPHVRCVDGRWAVAGVRRDCLPEQWPGHWTLPEPERSESCWGQMTVGMEEPRMRGAVGLRGRAIERGA